MGGLPSPSQGLQPFQNAVNKQLSGNPLSGFGGLGRQLNPRLTPDLGPKGQGTWKEKPGVQVVDPNTMSGESGPQQFGTVAADINPDQFVKENYAGKGLKGVKRLDEFGGLGGAMGGLMGGGMMPMGSVGGGFGGGFGGPFDLVQMLMGLLGQTEEEGPIRGR